MNDKVKYRDFLIDLLPVLEKHQAGISYFYDGDAHGIYDECMTVSVKGIPDFRIYESSIGVSECKELIGSLTRMINANDDIQYEASENGESIFVYTLIKGEYAEGRWYGFDLEYCLDQMRLRKARMERVK